MDVALDFPTGYILEVDLEYPQDLYDVQIYHFIQGAINRPANEKTNSSPRYTIRNVMLYIIETCSNVLVMDFG